MKRSSSPSGTTLTGAALAAVSLLLAGGVSAQPVITSLHPAEGPTVGGVQLTLQGAGLAGAHVTVTVGSATCSPTLLLEQVIQCPLPEGTGLQEVRVHVDGVTSNAIHFQYFSPMLQSVVPIKGPPSGGTPVTIRGTNFGPSASVLFGSSLASIESQTGHHELQVLSPPGTGTVPIVVVQEGGAQASSISFHYECPAGTIEGASGCSPCPAGTFGAAGAASCSLCVPGTFSAGGAASCSLCAPGTFSQMPGAASCLACAPGSFSGTPGSAACASCLSGSVAPAPGQASCEACPFGLDPNASATACGIGCVSDDDCGAPACDIATCAADGLCTFTAVADCCVDDDDCADGERCVDDVCHAELDAGAPDDTDAGDAGDAGDIDAGPFDDVDAGEAGDIDAGEAGDIDAGAPGVDAGGPDEVDAGDEDPVCAVEDGCCDGEACAPKDRDRPSSVDAEEPGVFWPGCAGSGTPSGALCGLALLLLALTRRRRGRAA